MIWLAFYKGRRKGLDGLFDALVRFWTRGPYSHCEIVFSGGEAASSSKRDGGVRFKHINFNHERWDFVTLDIDPVPVRGWFDAHLGEKYDTLGLFGFIWRPFGGMKTRWFCSEACAAALGTDDPWRFCPNTLKAASVILPGMGFWNT